MRSGAESWPEPSGAAGVGQAAVIDIAQTAPTLGGMDGTPLSDEDILSALGITAADELGSGGEALVYAFPGNRVARIGRQGSRLEVATARMGLLREIAASGATLPFRTPEVHSIELVGDRVVTIEARLRGEPVSQWLSTLTGVSRARLLEDYLETAASLTRIQINRTQFGPVIGDQSLRRDSWSEFARARLPRSAESCPGDLRDSVLAEATIDWPEPAKAGLVHLDYFPPNILADGERVTAVLDFGPSAVFGDIAMESWSAVAYLDAELSPTASDDDRAQALAWLENGGLRDGYPQARRWLAAMWSYASDDANLMAWCRRVLLMRD